MFGYDQVQQHCPPGCQTSVVFIWPPTLPDKDRMAKRNAIPPRLMPRLVLYHASQPDLRRLAQSPGPISPCPSAPHPSPAPSQPHRLVQTFLRLYIGIAEGTALRAQTFRYLRLEPSRTFQNDESSRKVRGYGPNVCLDACLHVCLHACLHTSPEQQSPACALFTLLSTHTPETWCRGAAFQFSRRY